MATIDVGQNKLITAGTTNRPRKRRSESQILIEDALEIYPDIADILRLSGLEVRSTIDRESNPPRLVEAVQEQNQDASELIDRASGSEEEQMKSLTGDLAEGNLAHIREARVNYLTDPTPKLLNQVAASHSLITASAFGTPSGNTEGPNPNTASDCTGTEDTKVASNSVEDKVDSKVRSNRKHDRPSLDEELEDDGYKVKRSKHVKIRVYPGSPYTARVGQFDCAGPGKNPKSADETGRIRTRNDSGSSHDIVDKHVVADVPANPDNVLQQTGCFQSNDGIQDSEDMQTTNIGVEVECQMSELEIEEDNENFADDDANSWNDADDDNNPRDYDSSTPDQSSLASQQASSDREVTNLLETIESEVDRRNQELNLWLQGIRTTIMNSGLDLADLQSNGMEEKLVPILSSEQLNFLQQSEDINPDAIVRLLLGDDAGVARIMEGGSSSTYEQGAGSNDDVNGHVIDDDLNNDDNVVDDTICTAKKQDGDGGDDNENSN